MSERRPIAEYATLDEAPDVIVGDEAGNQARASLDLDYGWMDISDLERPEELRFKPTWFEVAAASACDRATR